ncbi:GntR family transcriptional regulator [Fimbriiglobus ruber]|uniref:Transcriptional regulator, GntR family n=1 Tax=Fimbriiglobus ruber TaxID=1908690 RepID=A0A225DPY5_9BACT|nr:GntR family transcriptional regulator [Fimbriiglobus ruber]OWK38257.1 Transcriptional regulator, GntR family [Fimbriiglobus ruber]
MATSRGVLSTREQITDRLREDVFAGRLPAGERVSEAALADRFGVSRGPIREALSQLTSEGLFVTKQNCGVTVAPPAPEPIRDLILPIRRTLEVYAFKQIFDALGPDDFRFWDDVLFRMERACRQREWQLLPQLDLEFHRYVLEKAGSPDLFAIWQTIVTRLRAHFWETVREHDARNDLLRLHGHHAELLAAFRKGPKAAAVKALEQHIDEN